MSATFFKRNGALLLFTIAVVLTVAFLFHGLREITAIRRDSDSLSTYRRLEWMLEEGVTAPPESEALLHELEMRDPGFPSVLGEAPSEEAKKAGVRRRIEQLEGRELPGRWGSLRADLYLCGALWTFWLLATLALRLFVRPGPASSNGDRIETVPLSFTQMALDVQANPAPTSVRGYTERVLQSLSNLLILTGPLGNIQMVNEALCTTLGYSRGDILGKHVSVLLASEDGVTPGVSNVETEFRTRDERSIPALFSCSAVQDEEGQTEGLVIVAQDISERKASEQSLRASEKRLRALMERLVSAQEDERQKVARDLHDGMLQLVIAAEMQLTSFRKKLSAGSDDGRLKTGIEYLSEAVREGRRLINNLRPPTLDKFGLIQSLRQETTRLARELDCESEFEFEFEVGQIIIPTPIETTTFRIFQEALNNIRKYAKPQKVTVSVKIEGRDLVLTVTDDGVGFSRDSESFESGVGLHSMRERAELHGGRFTCRSELGKGTELQAVIPLEEV